MLKTVWELKLQFPCSDSTKVSKLVFVIVVLIRSCKEFIRILQAGEISPLLPNSCRYVPTCSEYSMEAYKKYGVVKGTVLTAWRLCRCNPLGNVFVLHIV